MKKSMYISGPISNMPNGNKETFALAQKRLKELNWDVVNPQDNDDGTNRTWDYYMRLCIPQLMRCDGILMLDGWLHSRGAKLECRIACALGMEQYLFQANYKYALRPVLIGWANDIAYVTALREATVSTHDMYL